MLESSVRANSVSPLRFSVAGVDFFASGESSLLTESLSVIAEYTEICPERTCGQEPVAIFNIFLNVIEDSDFFSRLAELRAGPARGLRKYQSEEIFERQSADAYTYYSKVANPIYDVSPSLTAVTFSRSNASPRELMRVCREMATRCQEDLGAVSLHAVAVEKGGRGLLVIGPSGAGKTTVLCHLLKCGYRLLSNDRVLYNPNSGNLYASPLPVRLSAGTVRSFASVNNLVRAGTFSRPQAVNATAWLKCDESTLVLHGREAKLELSPAEIAKALGSQLRQRASLSAVVIPKFVATACSLGSERLAAEQAVEVVRGESRTPNDDLWPDPWLVRRAHRNGLWNAAVLAIASSPVTRIVFGPTTTSGEVAFAADAALQLG